MRSRNEVLAEFTCGTVTRYYDTDAMANRIRELEEQLAGVEEEREQAYQVAQQNAATARALKARAERAERVVEAVAGLAEVDVISGGEYFDDICVEPVLTAYHHYVLNAADGA